MSEGKKAVGIKLAPNGMVVDMEEGLPEELMWVAENLFPEEDNVDINQLLKRAAGRITFLAAYGDVLCEAANNK